MLLAFIAGCSGGAEPAGPNEACFRALDCQAGLVCVEGRCTNDIGPLVPAGAGAAPQPEPEPESEGEPEGELESGGDAG
jgi:hypothetical protein